MKRFGKAVELFEDWTSGILIVTGLFILFYGVILRYILELPTTWQDEVARIFVVWGVLIGASATLRKNNHIRVDLLYKLFPQRFQRVIDIFANVVTLSFFVFLIVSGAQLVQMRLATGQTSLDGTPLWIIYLIIPFTGLLLSGRTIERLIRLFQGKPESDEDGHGSIDGFLKDDERVTES